jgi:hypothetical protein
VTLLASEPEVQYIALRNIDLILRKVPQILSQARIQCGLVVVSVRVVCVRALRVCMPLSVCASLCLYSSLFPFVSLRCG